MKQLQCLGCRYSWFYWVCVNFLTFKKMFKLCLCMCVFDIAPQIYVFLIDLIYVLLDGVIKTRVLLTDDCMKFGWMNFVKILKRIKQAATSASNLRREGLLQRWKLLWGTRSVERTLALYLHDPRRLHHHQKKKCRWLDIAAIPVGCSFDWSNSTNQYDQ